MRGDLRQKINLIVLTRFVERLDSVLQNACLGDTDRPLGENGVGDFAPHLSATTHAIEFGYKTWSWGS